MIIRQQFQVPFEFPVVFTDHVFAPENRVLVETLDRLAEKRRHRVVIYLDENVAQKHTGLLARIERYFAAHCKVLELAAPVQIVGGGENAKNGLESAFARVGEMLGWHLDRHALVLIIGGGAVLDAIGFAASLVHRGLRIVRLPTTVLAQNDAGVGVKTGLNFHGSKNALGTFAPPFAIVNDFQFLLSLSAQEWRSGAAEAFKVAIIRDRAFFTELAASAEKLRNRDEATMRKLVFRCAELHLAHIRTSGDPFELGRARPLDFGHWSAHKLETLSGFAISHGDAVATGILLDSCYAARRGWLNENELAEIHQSLATAGFPLWFEELEDPQLFEGLREFQEHLGGELCVTFPNGLGARQEVHEIDLAVMQEALTDFKNLVRR